MFLIYILTHTVAIAHTVALLTTWGPLGRLPVDCGLFSVKQGAFVTHNSQRGSGLWGECCVLYSQHLVQLFAVVAIVSKATEFYYPFCCAD